MELRKNCYEILQEHKGMHSTEIHARIIDYLSKTQGGLLRGFDNEGSSEESQGKQGCIYWESKEELDC